MSFPTMADAFSGWQTSVSLKVVRSSINDFEPVEQSITDKKFKAVLQPIPPQKLLVKPEGQRNWRWWTMWTRLNLEVGANVCDSGGLFFRVMSKSDWSGGGFIEYELAEAPSSEVTP